jgi:hypothetical protein
MPEFSINCDFKGLLFIYILIDVFLLFQFPPHEYFLIPYASETVFNIYEKRRQPCMYV